MVITINLKTLFYPKLPARKDYKTDKEYIYDLESYIQIAIDRKDLLVKKLRNYTFQQDKHLSSGEILLNEILGEKQNG